MTLKDTLRAPGRVCQRRSEARNPPGGVNPKIFRVRGAIFRTPGLQDVPSFWLGSPGVCIFWPSGAQRSPGRVCRRKRVAKRGAAPTRCDAGWAAATRQTTFFSTRASANYVCSDHTQRTDCRLGCWLDSR